MSGSWGASMQSALASTLAHPEWWAMALAAFLVRGGIVVVLLPVITLPTSASLTTSLAPSVEALILGRPSLDGVIVGTIVVGLLLAALVAAGVAGSWFDLALAREAAADEELELGWGPARASALVAFSVRMAAHVPTALALAYAAFRFVAAGYEELVSPGDASLPLAARIVLRAPDAVLLVVAAWYLGEAVGGLAARRVAGGEPVGGAIRRSVRGLAERRGLATLLLTTLVVSVVTVTFVFAVGRAWERVRGFLIEGVEPIDLGAALVLLIGSWVLGLAILGGALAWRATAWSVLVAPRSTAEPEPEPGAVAAREIAPG